MNREQFIRDYVEAALWAEDDESEAWAAADVSEQAEERFERDAGTFYDANQDDCDAYERRGQSAGHDFWFTRRGHGVGFWEVDTPEAERLDAAAKAAGDCELYIGDDGMIYAC
jgi:hypothetical protein